MSVFSENHVILCLQRWHVRFLHVLWFIDFSLWKHTTIICYLQYGWLVIRCGRWRVDPVCSTLKSVDYPLLQYVILYGGPGNLLNLSLYHTAHVLSDFLVLWSDILYTNIIAVAIGSFYNSLLCPGNDLIKISQKSTLKQSGLAKTTQNCQPNLL